MLYHHLYVQRIHVQHVILVPWQLQEEWGQHPNNNNHPTFPHLHP
jgi:hypothetical protein